MTWEGPLLGDLAKFLKLTYDDLARIRPSQQWKEFYKEADPALRTVARWSLRIRSSWPYRCLRKNDCREMQRYVEICVLGSIMRVGLQFLYITLHRGGCFFVFRRHRCWVGGVSHIEVTKSSIGTCKVVLWELYRVLQSPVSGPCVFSSWVRTWYFVLWAWPAALKNVLGPHLLRQLRYSPSVC